MNSTLLIIPAYNEAENIERVVDNLIENYPQFDYVVINDGSRDDTRKILYNRGYNYLDLPVNTGLAGAFRCGVRYANAKGYDYVVQFDGDGQHRADYIARLIAPIERGEVDMAIGSRFVPHGDGEDKGFQSSAARRMGIRWISGLIRIGTGRTIRDVTSGFRACGPVLTAYFAQNYAQDYPEPEAIVTALGQGMRVCEVPVRMNERQGGVSSIRALKSLHYMIKVSLAILLDSFRLGSRKEKKA